MIKAVVFDFDGVLYDSFDFHMNHVGAFFDVDFSPETYRSMHDGNMFASAPTVLQGADWDAYNQHVRGALVSAPMSDVIKKGIVNLSALYKLSIITSGNDQNVADFLTFNDTAQYFEAILGIKTHRSKVKKFEMLFQSHNLHPDEVVFVTDTLGDILEGHEANVKTIAVDFGFHDRARLEKGNPHAIVSDFDGIIEIVKSF